MHTAGFPHIALKSLLNNFQVIKRHQSKNRKAYVETRHVTALIY